MREAALRAVSVAVPNGVQGAEPLFPLDVSGLRFDAGGSRLIDIPQLRLDAGGITMLMGPNGAGKTLLLRLLHGLAVPSAGTIRWGGAVHSPAIARRQALVFQKPVLLRRSVIANVEFVLKARGRDPNRAGALLEQAGLAGKARRPARRLSGGEQQRLALARALAVEPEVIFLDEPTASLDPASVHAFEVLVRDISRRGTRIIFVTHDIGQARRLADDVLFLHGGQVAEHAAASGFFAGPASAAARAYLSGRLVL